MVASKKKIMQDNIYFNLLRANPTKWSDTPKQIVGNFADELFKRVCSFCGVGAERVNNANRMECLRSPSYLKVIWQSQKFNNTMRL